jgi:hypothetical protein
VFKDAEIQIVQSGGTMVFEASLPLSGLQLHPTVTEEIAGDIGRIVGAASGNGAKARFYWSNPDTNAPPDLPGGAEIRPATWGRFKFGGE